MKLRDNSGCVCLCVVYFLFPHDFDSLSRNFISNIVKFTAKSKKSLFAEKSGERASERNYICFYRSVVCCCWDSYAKLNFLNIVLPTDWSMISMKKRNWCIIISVIIIIIKKSNKQRRKYALKSMTNANALLFSFHAVLLQLHTAKHMWSKKISIPKHTHTHSFTLYFFMYQFFSSPQWLFLWSFEKRNKQNGWN